MTDAIATQNLTRRYGDKIALNALNWSAPEGSICGLLGPNGAGKTTILKILLGIAHPTSGSAQVLGFDIVRDSIEIRKHTAFVPEDKALYDSLTGREFLRMYGSFFPNWSDTEAERLTSEWHLPTSTKIRHLSRGIRGRLLLAAALSRKPRLLLLDEPTDALDPAAAEELLHTLTTWVAEKGRTVIIATHRLEEVQRICDRIVLIDNGGLLLSGELDDLRAAWKRIDYMPGEQSADATMQRISAWPEVHDVRRRGQKLQITTNADPHGVAQKLQQLPGAGEIEVSGMNLREIYLAAVKAIGGSHDKD